ncbi:phosphate-regulating neutral endopeptidase PHEX-like [Dermacentor andersoni]|uniref:phosphate-regulating neutral endopeptidase PHEX-like n=1 Tax=Dermacentor andersoni TaxID=34620 RepID=UPI002416D469|nr:endothelin-converting enzyme 1-like [Dermacentor andersoni]
MTPVTVPPSSSPRDVICPRKSSMPKISTDSAYSYPSIEEPLTATPPFIPWEQHSRRHDQRLRTIGMLLLSAVTVIALLVVFTLLLTGPRTARSTREPCWTLSCRRYVDLLEASMDTTLDPCQDFHAFVCSRWKPEAGGRTFLEDAMLAVQNVVIERATVAKIPAKYQNRSQKATMLYQSCLAKGVHGTGSFRAFLDIVMGSPWPDINTSTDPLGVLLDLSFQWRCPVFFYAFYAQHASDERELSFLDSSAGLDFPGLFTEYRSRGDHDRYICELHAALNNGADRTDGEIDSPNRTRWCRALARFQRDALSELEPHSRESRRTYYASLYEFATEATPDVAGDRWMRVVAAHARQGERVMSTTPVEVEKPAYLKALTRIIGEKPREEVLSFIGLTIVQVIGRFASADLATIIYNAASVAGRKRQRMFCYQLADAAVPSALSNAYLFEKHRVSKAREIADVVVASSKDRLRSAGWLTARSRVEVTKKIAEAPLVFEGMQREAEAMGEEFPMMSTFFLENSKNLPNDIWVRFRRPHTDGADTTNVERIGSPWRQVTSQHGHFRLVIPDVYMSERVFPDAAYESISYGTVGSLVARQVASALDLEGRKVDSDGLRRDMLTHAERSTQERTIECLVGELERRYNATRLTSEADKSALYVAWASLAPLMDARLSNIGLPEFSTSLKLYSPQQLLFIALCFIGCSREPDSDVSATGFSAASWCNFPLSLFKPFADSFECPAESPMRSVHACEE